MEYLFNRYETIKKNTKEFNINNTFGITKFVSVMKNL
jgi:hypothetical protein